MIYGFIAIDILIIISLLILCMMLDYQSTRLMSEIKLLKHPSIDIKTNSHGQLHLNQQIQRIKINVDFSFYCWRISWFDYERSWVPLFNWLKRNLLR